MQLFDDRGGDSGTEQWDRQDTIQQAAYRGRTLLTGLDESNPDPATDGIVSPILSDTRTTPLVSISMTESSGDTLYVKNNLVTLTDWHGSVAYT